MGHLPKDEVGSRYGRLTVVARDGRLYGGNAAWLCKCDCGKSLTVSGSSLRTGNTRSCGCLHREVAAKQKALPDGISAMNAAILTMKQNAKSRDIEWELPLDIVQHLMRQNCHYCGSPPSNYRRSRKSSFRYNGLDRLDSSRGYRFDNVVPCCATCNTAKLDMPYTAFVEWIHRVHWHLENQE